MPQQRDFVTYFGRDTAKRRDPAPRSALVRGQPLRGKARLPPREPPLAVKAERVHEIVERNLELLDEQQKLVGRDATLAGLYRRDSLPGP